MTVSSELRLFCTSFVVLFFQTGIVTACNGTTVISARSGKLLSPNYPSVYDNNLRCTWELQSPNGGQIVLTFHVFSLEFEKACVFDYIKIYEGTGIRRKTYKLKACGREMENKTVVTSSKAITLYLKTDGSAVYKGFNITWATYGGAFNDVRKPVTSPKSYFYHGPVNSTYTLMVPGNMSAIKVNFSRTVFDSNIDCLIQISDSRNKNIGKVCTRSDTKVFNTNEIILTVTSIYGSTAVLNITFKEYEKTITPCLKRMSTERYGTIQSPLFPFNYGDELYCTWEIRAANQGRIMLTFHEFDIEYDKDCTFDFLMIYDGSMEATNVLLNKACGSEMMNKTMVSTSDAVVVVFNTDINVNEQGFNITWESCDFGKYGVDCKYDCTGNCLNGVTCNILTGRCDDGCADGWKGDKCDIGCGNSNLIATIIGISSLIVILLLSIAVLGLCFRLKRLNRLQTIRNGNGGFAMRGRETLNEARYVSDERKALDLSKQCKTEDIEVEDYENVVDTEENLLVYENVPEELRRTDHIRGKGVVSDEINDDLYEDMS